MADCPRCGGDFDVDDLVRHERESLVRVHCPDCATLLGDYDRRTH